MNDNGEPNCRIDFHPAGKRVIVAANTTVLSAAQKAGIPLTATCGGLGKCGQCRVRIVEGKVPAATEQEAGLLSRRAIDDMDRLACQTPVQQDMTVGVPPDSLPAGVYLQLDGAGQALAPDPMVSACPIALPPPSIQDARSDFARVAHALASVLGAGPCTAAPRVIRQLPAAARQNHWRLTAYMRGAELIGLAPPELPPLGVAVDLGTTTIAAALLDLQTGRELSVQGMLNPQMAYGQDLIARLAHADTSGANAETLAATVSAAIDDLIGKLADDVGADRCQIADLCIVGNTAMTHLLLSFPVGQLAGAPYVAATHASMDINAGELGLRTAPGANVHIPGCIGGFVGGDHVSMILASGIHRSEHVTLGIDIGTNTEIVLYTPHSGSLTACSCASGPAFEGGHVRCGMRAARGAIEAVRLSPEGVSLTTVGGAPAIGLCGSGIIDAVAELLRWDIINPSGRLDSAHPLVRPGDNGPEFVLAAAARSGGGHDIVITQKDINEIQLAKGAIRAGLDTLLAAADMPGENVAELIVAGAFGSCLDLERVCEIGMFPRFPNARLRQVGNAALAGAKMILLSKDERRSAQQIIDASAHLESSTRKAFSRYFALGVQFPIMTACSNGGPR